MTPERQCVCGLSENLNRAGGKWHSAAPGSDFGQEQSRTFAGSNRRNGMVLVTFRAIPGENDGFSDNPSNTIPGPKYTRLASQMYHVPELSVGTCSYRVVDDVQ